MPRTQFPLLLRTSNHLIYVEWVRRNLRAAVGSLRAGFVYIVQVQMLECRTVCHDIATWRRSYLLKHRPFLLHFCCYDVRIFNEMYCKCRRISKRQQKLLSVSSCLGLPSTARTQTKTVTRFAECTTLTRYINLRNECLEGRRVNGLLMTAKTRRLCSS